MPRPPKHFAIDRVLDIAPSLRAGAVRSTYGFLPSRFEARVLLREPAGLVVYVDLQVQSGGQPRIHSLAVTPGVDFAVPINTATLRQIAVEQLVKAVLAEAAKPFENKVTERPDIAPGAFQIQGDDPNSYRISPRPTATQNARKAAEIYLKALSEGSRAPTEAVRVEMEISRSQASRYIRKARDAGFLPSVGAAADPGPPDRQQYVPSSDVPPVQHPGIPQAPCVPPGDGAPGFDDAK